MSQARFDASTAPVRVFTYAEGMLSAMAHDLEIEVGECSLELDTEARTVSARFSASSLRVLHAVRDGAPLPQALSARDRAEIERNLRDQVLHAARFPEIHFEGRAVSDERVEGTLTLHGVQRPLAVSTQRDAGGWVGRASLHQPDFGITPYRAMLGALKVKPQVSVVVRVPSVE